MIKLQVIGHLGKDCVTNQVNGKTVMNFTVAHSEKFKDSQGNQQDRTTWVECAYWSDRTGVAPYLKKGTLVYVEGAPELKTFPKKDGTTGASLNLRVMSVQLLGGGNRNESGMGGGEYNQGQQNGGYQSRQPAAASDITEPIDDLPF